MPNWNDPFIPSMEEIETGKAFVYEEALVKQLLKYYGKAAFQRQLLTGQEHLTFQAFVTQFGFPMWLASGPVKGLSAETFLELHHRPTKTGLYEAWQNAVEDMPADYAQNPKGFVFSWTGWGKFIVLHDCPSKRTSGKPQMRFWIAGESLYLEPLEDLLDDLGGPTAIAD